MKGILYCFAAIVISGCSSSQDDQINRQQLIAPGVLDLPVLPGSFIPSDCGVDWDFDPGEEILGCVAWPLDRQTKQDNSLYRQYIGMLESNGWTYVIGLANAFFLERPVNGSTCVERLVLGVDVLGDKLEVAKYRTSTNLDIDWSKIPNGVIYFAMDDNQATNIEDQKFMAKSPLSPMPE